MAERTGNGWLVSTAKPEGCTASEAAPSVAVGSVAAEAMLPGVTCHADGSSNPSTASLADAAIADSSFAMPPSGSADPLQPVAKKANSNATCGRVNCECPFCSFMVLLVLRGSGRPMHDQQYAMPPGTADESSLFPAPMVIFHRGGASAAAPKFHAPCARCIVA